MNQRVALAVRVVRVDPVVARRRDDRAFGGRPPSFPFSRDEAALRFDLTDPRQAGQNETKSIRWIGHFGIFPSSDNDPILSCWDRT
jgi:hypothetical protein